MKISFGFLMLFLLINLAHAQEDACTLAPHLKLAKFAACDIQYSYVFLDFSGSDISSGKFAPVTRIRSNGKNIVYDKVSYDPASSELQLESDRPENSISIVIKNVLLNDAYVRDIGSGSCDFMMSGSHTSCSLSSPRRSASFGEKLTIGNCDLSLIGYPHYNRQEYKPAKDCELLPKLHMTKNGSVTFKLDNLNNWPVVKFPTIVYSTAFFEHKTGIIGTGAVSFYDSGNVKQYQLYKKETDFPCGIKAKWLLSVGWPDGNQQVPAWIKSEYSDAVVTVRGKVVAKNGSTVFFREKVKGSDEFYIADCTSNHGSETCSFRERLICD